MVRTAKRDHELIAYPATQSSRLHEPQVMSVRRLPTAHKARPGRDELQVIRVPVTPWFT
jgi:hypothetical protein